MNRKEKILQCVRQMVDEQETKTGIDSGTIAEALGLERSNVSRDLNELVREGLVVKSESRPVLFMEASVCEDLVKKAEEEDGKTAFSNLIGRNGSLKSQIEQGKSAILYPPRGLHTLLAGPTGTGKTTFAEKMYEYAAQSGIIREKEKLIVFNCAEYAQNPQLILSQLFGCKKGAYTGAEKDKIGLVEQADGGILLLDEIHRLPPEGQEMLFLLMDKGIYRRLGETDKFREADVLIIGATTENINTVLLKTFLRRMPVVIHLPALNERPIVERLQLIEMFFVNEQKKVGVPIRVYKEALIALLLYYCPGNIGQLKADIQLVCARAFLQYKVDKLQYVTVELPVLPEYIQKGRLEHQNQKNDLIEFLRYSDDYHFFEGEETIGNQKQSLYDIISEKYQTFKQQGRTKGQITGILQEDLDRYMEQLMEKYHVTDQEDGRKNLLKIINANVYYAVEEVIQFAEVRLERKLSEQAKIGMTMHVNAMLERIENGVPIREEVGSDIVLNHPKEFRVAKTIKRLLEEELDVQIPERELVYLTMFLCVSNEQIKQYTGILVMAHGNSTASSMSEVVNQLMNTDHCKALDMPLDMSTEIMLEKAVAMVKKIDEGKGVLLLTDMGSLNMMGELIEQKTGIKVRTITLASTAIVLEALRKSLMQDMSLDEIYADLKQTFQFLIKNQDEKKNMGCIQHRIITTCFTGQGTAVKIKDIIMEMLPGALKDMVHIQCMDFRQAADVQNGKEGLRRKRIDAVVGTVDLKLDGVPYISVDELIAGEGMRRLEHILSNASDLNISNEQESDVKTEILAETLSGILAFLNPAKIIPLLMKSFEELTTQEKNRKDIKFRYVIHTACMLERIMQGEIIQHKQTDEIKKKYETLFNKIKQSLGDIEHMLHIDIPDSEIVYLIEMMENI